MKRRLLPLLASLVVTTVCGQPGTWIQISDFGGGSTERYGAVAFNINGKGYVGTGKSIDGLQKDLWEFDPIGNTWSQKADLVGPARKNAVGFSIGNRGYVGGGSANDVLPAQLLTDFWEYDPTTNTWTSKADLLTASQGAVGFAINSKGYVGTGSDMAGNATSDFFEFDPELNTWTEKYGYHGAGRSGAVGFSIGGIGYIGTGVGSNYLADFWAYNPASDTWTRKADFAGGTRYNAAGFSNGNKGYIGTGSSGSPSFTVQKDFWEYSPETDQWTQKNDVGTTPRNDAVAFVIGTKGYVGLGSSLVESGTLHKDFWEYIGDGLLITNSITGTNCSGSTYTVSYQSTGISFGTDNIFTAYLSDAGGNFATSVVIGSVTSTNLSGTLNISIPKNIDSGSGYQIRVASSNPKVTASSITFPISEIETRSLRITAEPNSPFFEGSNVVFTAFLDSYGYLSPAPTDASYQWMNNGNNSGVNSSTYMNTNFANGDIVTCTMTGKGKCSSATSNPIQLTVYAADRKNVWVQRHNLPSAIPINLSFSIGSKGYVGGLSNSDNILWEYDPVTNVWSQKSDQPEPGTAFSVGTKGYICSNLCGGTKNLWEYDPTLNQWIKKSAFPGELRSGVIGLSAEGRGYLMGGYSCGSSGTLYYNHDLWAYDQATDSWSKKADFPEGTYDNISGIIFYADFGSNQAAGFSIGSMLYLSQRSLWQYNPANDKWVEKKAFPGGTRAGRASFSIGGKGYMGQGELFTKYYNSTYNDFFEYDSYADEWREIPNLPPLYSYGRVYSAAFSVSGKGYVGGGQVGDGHFWEYGNDFWEYTPEGYLITTVSGDSFCPGETFSVGFSAVGLTFLSGNVFTAQLSDPTGNFSNPVNLGTLTGTEVAGSITSTIPDEIPSGDGYRIRVIASNKPVTSGGNGLDISICTEVFDIGTEPDIFPNPFQRFFKLSLSAELTNVSDYKFDIVNNLGQVVYRCESAEHDNSIDFTGKPSGLYIVILRHGNQLMPFRIIKIQ